MHWCSSFASNFVYTSRLIWLSRLLHACIPYAACAYFSIRGNTPRPQYMTCALNALTKILAMGLLISTYVRTVFRSELKLCKLEVARAYFRAQVKGWNKFRSSILFCSQNLHANTAARLSMCFMHIFCLLCLVDQLMFRSTIYSTIITIANSFSKVYTCRKW